MAEYDTVAIVGVGLIGGSIGLALRERRLAQRIIGIGRRQANLDVARQVGAIDHGVTSLAAGVSEAQLVVVATPVDTIAEKVIQAAAACPASSLITDAGSTKEAIVSAVDAGLAGRRSGPRFVGSHPLAGDHRTGAAHARGRFVRRPHRCRDADAIDAAGRRYGSLAASGKAWARSADDDAGRT